jgi:hypothetical protein
MAVRLESDILLLLIQYDPKFFLDGCFEILLRFLRFPPKLPTDLASSPRAMEPSQQEGKECCITWGKRTLKRSPAQRAADPHLTTILLPPATKFLGRHRISVHPASVLLCQSL